MTRSAPQPSSVPPERRFADRRPEGPRRVKNGLKLSTRDGRVARTPFAQRWLAVIEAHVGPDAAVAGLEYARLGQIVSMHVMAGAVEAQVQGTAGRPYLTRMLVPAIEPAQWDRLIESMAGEAIHVAKLLAGELPPGLDEVFAANGSGLVPDASAVSSTCTCAAGAACKHAAAVGAMLVDGWSDEPLRAFTLLGVPADRLLERLRRARALHTHGVASAHGESAMSDMRVMAPPLESQIDDFWHAGADLDGVTWQPPTKTVNHALLRRLGPSPLAGKFPMVGLLASIYDAVSSAADRRDGADNDAS